MDSHTLRCTWSINWAQLVIKKKRKDIKVGNRYIGGDMKESEKGDGMDGHNQYTLYTYVKISENKNF